MSETEKFTLRQIVASCALESNGLTDDLLNLLKKAIIQNMDFDELIPFLVDGKP